jgi:hypothetical protein
VLGDYAVPAGHVVTYGGAALTLKGLYDMMTSSKERELQDLREREFHDARMRVLDAAQQQYSGVPQLPPMTLGPAADPLARKTDPNEDPFGVLPTDLKKLSSFDPRQPIPPKPAVPVKPSALARAGESITSSLEHLLCPPIQSSMHPIGVTFDPNSESVLRV